MTTLVQKVDFSIELDLEVNSISKAPYKMSWINGKNSRSKCYELLN